MSNKKKTLILISLILFVGVGIIYILGDGDEKKTNSIEIKRKNTSYKKRENTSIHSENTEYQYSYREKKMRGESPQNEEEPEPATPFLSEVSEKKQTAYVRKEKTKNTFRKKISNNEFDEDKTNTKEPEIIRTQKRVGSDYLKGLEKLNSKVPEQEEKKEFVKESSGIFVKVYGTHSVGLNDKIHFVTANNAIYKGMNIPKNTIIYGLITSVSSGKMKIVVKEIRTGEDQYFKPLNFYSMDFGEGIKIESNEKSKTGRVAKSVASRGLQTATGLPLETTIEEGSDVVNADKKFMINSGLKGYFK